ncbi:MAG TPA: hypothetical protein VNJ11_11075 [Bryobacteraceae bacterium]|nr:hypothetical protein [Bryobacteraceae bacterium]
MSDLICLVPDKNTEAAVEELFERHEALGMRCISAKVVVHPRRDPGVFHEGVEFVRSVQTAYQHGLLLLDAAWEGAPPDIQKQLDRELAKAGLGGWARAIVIAPELEAWVWSDSPRVAEALGWAGRQPALRSWLEQEGLWGAQDPKPKEPKKAVERALWQVQKPRSSAIYRTLARRVGVERCRDSAFLRLRETLQEWFGA